MSKKMQNFLGNVNQFKDKMKFLQLNTTELYHSTPN